MGKSNRNNSRSSDKKDSNKDEPEAKKKKLERSSGIKPFFYVAEEWPEDASSQTLKTTEGRQQVTTKMFILNGNEIPKQLMIYLKSYEARITMNILLMPREKLAFLKRIVDKEVLTILKKVEDSFKSYAVPADIDKIHNHQVRTAIRTEFDTDERLIAYFTVTGNAAAKKKRVTHIIEESI